MQGKNQSGALKDKTVMEWSKTQLLRLEESLEAMEKQIGSTHPHVSLLLLMHSCLHPACYHFQFGTLSGSSGVQ